MKWLNAWRPVGMCREAKMGKEKGHREVVSFSQKIT
jgi:hypothetical protein